MSFQLAGVGFTVCSPQVYILPPNRSGFQSQACAAPLSWCLSSQACFPSTFPRAFLRLQRIERAAICKDYKTLPSCFTATHPTPLWKSGKFKGGLVRRKYPGQGPTFHHSSLQSSNKVLAGSWGRLRLVLIWNLPAWTLSGLWVSFIMRPVSCWLSLAAELRQLQTLPLEPSLTLNDLVHAQSQRHGIFFTAFHFFKITSRL